MLEALRPGAVCVVAGTLTPARVRVLSDKVTAAGGVLLDAPVAGSTPQTEAGVLRSLVGGPAEALEVVRPVLETWSGAVVHAGPVGAGATLKLMVNGLFATQVAAMAELLTLAEAQGCPPASLLELLADTPVCSPAAAHMARRMLQSDHPSQFPVRLVEKDLRYVVAATGGPVVGPVSEAARAVFAGLVDQGLGEANLTVVGWHRLRTGRDRGRERAASTGAGR